MVADAVLDEADQPVVADRVEEPRDVGVHYPVHLCAIDPDRQRVQRKMLAPPWSEAVAEPEEVFLVDRVQHLDQRALDDLILQRRDAERARSAIRLRHERPPRRLCSIRSPMNTAVQVLEPALDILAVVAPCHLVHASRRLAFQRVIGG